MNNATICDFCEERESEGVYSTDYAPVSLCYCSECQKITNIRPKEIAIYGWARLGVKYFTPRIWKGVSYPPMVYSEGKYITVEELIKNLTLNKIDEYVTTTFRKELILEKFLESKNEMINN
jgi:hypothetical protein